MAPTVERIRSVGIVPDGSTSITAASPSQITASAVSQTTVTSTALAALGTASVGRIMLEALDGDCKGQRVIVTANNGLDPATVTPFWKTSPTGTRFRLWNLNWKTATATSHGNSTTITSTYRTEASDTWGGKYRMLCVRGTYNTGDQVAISSFDPVTDTFTVGTMTGMSVAGDFYLPIRPIEPSELSMVIGETPIERNLINDSLDGEGVVPGAMTPPTMDATLEVRGLTTAAGNGTAADPPKEINPLLQTCFSQTLNTGDTAQAGSTTASVNVADSTRFADYTMALAAGGDFFGISAAAGNVLAVPTGHLSAAPATNDVIYGAANYTPKTDPSSVSALIWTDAQICRIINGLVPALKLNIAGDELVRLTWSMIGVNAIYSDLAQPHDGDTYDTGTPIPGKSNICRVVLDGTEITAAVMSIEADLITAPTRAGAAFGACENNAGMKYTTREIMATIVLQMEDTDYPSRFRAGGTFDLLVQTGRIPTAASALWIPRAQIVASPTEAAADGFLQWSIVVRALRNTTQDVPPAILAFA